MKRILLRSPNWIGDQILAYPFYYRLREVYPDAWISVVCTEWVKDIQFRGLVDEVFVLPRQKSDSFLKSMKTIWNFAKILKQNGPWDLGISLPNSFGAALLLYLARVKTRRGYATDARGFLLNQKVEWIPGSDTHRSQAYLNLLSFEGLPDYLAKNYWLASRESSFDSIRYWPDIIPIEPPRGEYFIVAPGATADSRRWTVDQFADLIDHIQQKWKYKAVIVGGNAEREIAVQLLQRGLDVQDFTGKGWVSAHWKLFRNAKFTVCNESGLAHVASLCGSDVHIVCGAADPKRTRPIGPGRVQISINPVECWPCERNVCQFTDARRNQCLKGIHPDRVMGEIELGFISRA